MIEPSNPLYDLVGNLVVPGRWVMISGTYPRLAKIRSVETVAGRNYQTPGDRVIRLAYIELCRRTKDKQLYVKAAIKEKLVKVGGVISHTSAMTILGDGMVLPGHTHNTTPSWWCSSHQLNQIHNTKFKAEVEKAFTEKLIELLNE